MSSPSADAVNARIDSFALGTAVSGSGATTAAAPPAGGTGATAGAFADAATRDAFISCVNNIRLDLDAVKTAQDNLITVLKNNHLIPQ